MYMIWDYYNGEPRLIGQTEDKVEVQEIIDNYIQATDYECDIEVICNGFYVTNDFYCKDESYLDEIGE
jgi:hypothetical protein